MTADRSQALPAELVDRAGERLLAVAGAARAAALADLIAAHPEHADALRTLCGDLDGVEHLLQSGYSEAAPVPEQLCGYRVVRRLGEGAFGIVYLCAQERPVVRDVAIKVLRPGAGDPKTLQRFAAERQVLAQLNHPGITQVFDAGELPDGRPFFVMEYVDGTPLHEWCVAQSVPCAARLRLFVDVCRAVAHAHTRGIVHRDLKPANVLVVATPDGPVPKVIDFGIAKALGGSADGEPRTEVGRVVGTPGYMSPEQAAGRIDEVDPRADVFSLGVMLYELLTDHMPWARTTTASGSDPVRPSARVTTVGDRATNGATSRRRLAAELRGDLDWITLQAIARERDERYASVTELANDVERHLRGETVSAGPPSLRYRLRKFVRRHRSAVLAVTAITVAAVGTTFAVVHASRMESEAGDARRDAATGLADSREFVARLLQRANDPVLFGAAHGDDMRRTLGTEALAFTDRLLATRANDPALLHDRCDALHVIAEVHRLLGEPSRSLAVASQAVGIAQQLVDEAPDDVRRRGLLGKALRPEASAIALGGDLPAAKERFAAAIGHFETCFAADPAGWQQLLATTLRESAASSSPQQRQSAIALYQKSLVLLEAIRADAAQRTATQTDYVAAMLGLGWQLLGEERFDDAWAQVEHIAGELATLGHARLRATSDFHRLRGTVARRRGEGESTLADFEAAAQAAEEWCKEQPRRIATHRHLVAALDSLGAATNTFGNFDDASAAYRRAIAAAEGMMAQFPDDRTARASLSARLSHFAYILYDRFRRRDLGEAAGHVGRAIELDDQLGDAVVAGRQPRWHLLATRAQIAESGGDPGAGDAWQRVDELLPTDVAAQIATPSAWFEAMFGVAAMHLANGATATAAQRVAAARSFVTRYPKERKARVAISWLEARLAALARDPAAAAAAADRILADRPTWFGSWRAGDCLCLAADCSDAATANGHRARAEELYRRVVRTLDGDVRQHPDDPWFVLPWGFAQLRLAGLAAIGGKDAAARDLLAAALPRLEAVREDAHRDQWQADTFAAGVALRERLQH